MGVHRLRRETSTISVLVILYNNIRDVLMIIFDDVLAILFDDVLVILYDRIVALPCIDLHISCLYIAML